MQEGQNQQEQSTDQVNSRVELNAARTRTAQLFQDLLQLIKEEASGRAFLVDEPKTHQPPERHRTKHPFWLFALKAFPPMMVLLFIASFIFPLEGITYQFFGHTFAFEGILRIISVSAIIGYATNWVAIKMLFRPQKKRPILGHGLIPAQKNRIAFRLAQAVSKDLINPDLIKEKIHESGLVAKYRERITLYLKDFIESSEFREGLKHLFRQYFDDLLSDPELRAALARQIVQHLNNILEKNLMEKVALKVYTTVKGRDMQEVVEEAMDKMPMLLDAGLGRLDEIMDELPTNLEKHSSRIEEVFTTILFRLINQLDVHDLVESNLRKFDETKLEGLILGATNDQLHYIQHLGAIFGAIGGLVIWEPMIAGILLATVASTILLLDRLLGGAYS